MNAERGDQGPVSGRPGGHPTPRKERVYACERPEAPPTDGVFFHTATKGCRGCVIALEAAVHNYPNHVNPLGRTVDQLLARARARLEMETTDA